MFLLVRDYAKFELLYTHHFHSDERYQNTLKTCQDYNKGAQLDIFLIGLKDKKFICRGHTSDTIRWKCKIRDYNDIFPLKETKFEDITVYIPNKYKKISKELWGDYPPKLPPVEKRFPHEGLIQILK